MCWTEMIKKMEVEKGREGMESLLAINSMLENTKVWLYGNCTVVWTRLCKEAPEW